MDATAIPDLIAYRIAGRDGMYVVELWGYTPPAHILAAAIAEEHGVPDANVQFIHTAA